MKAPLHQPMRDGFYPRLAELMMCAPWERLGELGVSAVSTALAAERLSVQNFLALLSPAAEPHLEAMARKARAATLRHFGRTVQLFTPLYLANLCTNHCLYCGFSALHRISRSKLTLDEVEMEAKAIAASGLRRILALTGDAPTKTGADYLADCVAVLARYFSSVGIEVPSMSTGEYAKIVAAGADSMTLFQETYNEALYAQVHPAGPKRDFSFRLDAPQRAVEGGLRGINLGPLLGLDDWRRELFLVGMHADFLSQRYPHIEISLSLPRLRPCGDLPSGTEDIFSPQTISDRHFVQALTAFRCFLPHAGITLSTREPASLRDRLIPLGVTRVSAGVSTAVGGHTVHKVQAKGVAGMNNDASQFDISDHRSVAQMAEAIHLMGYQPVFADWVLSGDGRAGLSVGQASALGTRSRTDVQDRVLA